MDDSTILSGDDVFDREGIEASVRVHSGANVDELRGRSYYYDGDHRLILVDYSVVDEEQVPEEEQRDVFDRYLKSWEQYHKAETLPEDPLLGGESRGWHTDAHSDPAETFLPVEGNTVIRELKNLPVPSFILHAHYNFREGVFEDGGLWDEVMEASEE